MAKAITASCWCGGVRISCGDRIGPASYCHCADCRKCTGSAFGVSIAIDLAEFRVLSGRIGSFTRTADSGTPVTRHFCLDCGSPLHSTSPGHPDRVYLEAGVLDDPAAVRPGHQSWTASKVHWAEIDPELPAYPTNRP